MWYLVSFLGGALGFAFWDKKTSNTSFNITAAIAEAAVVYLLIKKLK